MLSDSSEEKLGVLFVHHIYAHRGIYIYIIYIYIYIYSLLNYNYYIKEAILQL